MRKHRFQLLVRATGVASVAAAFYSRSRPEPRVVTHPRSGGEPELYSQTSDEGREVFVWAGATFRRLIGDSGLYRAFYITRRKGFSASHGVLPQIGPRLLQAQSGGNRSAFAEGSIHLQR